MSEEKLIYSFRPSKLAIGMYFKLFALTFLLPFLLVITVKPLLAVGIGVTTAVVFGGKAAVLGLDKCFTKCSLYKSYLEYKEGWFHIHKKVIKYDNIVDVSYTQLFSQRLFGYGTVAITTKGLEKTLKMDMIGIPDKRYKMIKQIITLAQKNPALLNQMAELHGPIEIPE